MLTQVLPYPPDSGPKIRTWNLIRFLSGTHEITLVSFVRGDQSAEVQCLREHGVGVHTVPIERGILPEVAALMRSLTTSEPFLIARDRRKAMRRLVTMLAAKERFDVVHADQVNMAQYADLVRGVPKVLDAHNALWLLYRRLCAILPPGARRLLFGRDWRLLRTYEARACRRFDATLAVSAEDRCALEEAVGGPSRIEVVPIAVDIGALPVVRRRAPSARIVHLGTMYWPPNVDAVCWFAHQVYPLVRERCPGVSFEVAGARPAAAVVRAARRTPGMTISGYVPDPNELLERAGVFVVPLRAGSGMRVKILHALARGVPVVTTSLGCEGIAVEDATHVLIADTAAAFADAVLRLLDDRELASRIARNGRRLIEERYDYRAVYPQVDALYRNLVGRKASAPGGN